MSKALAVNATVSGRQRFFDFLYKWGMLLTVVLLVAVFGLASDNFLDPFNIINILRSIAIVTVIAIGVSISLTIGGNPEAARLSGLRITRYKVAAYVIASLLAGLGGILLASRIGSSQVNAGGGYLMDAVAAAWIGFSLAGSGKPNALGTLVGAVILGVLSNGLVMLSVPYYAMDIIKGLVLAGALALTYFQRRT
ncbi:ABC transporter permease [Klebsiella pneumoniae]|uniref:ABC transporter permease n=1 Tax=Klebsiella pneumoniae TaxID=573 RepID=UPI004046819B